MLVDVHPSLRAGVVGCLVTTSLPDEARVNNLLRFHIQVEPSHNSTYHFMTDMTNQAIAWMQYQKALTKYPEIGQRLQRFSSHARKCEPLFTIR
jgi:hypothetical protein